jgi:hypothetical protein
MKLVPMHGTAHMKCGEWKQYRSGKKHWPAARPADLHDLAAKLSGSTTLLPRGVRPGFSNPHGFCIQRTSIPAKKSQISVVTR